MLPDFADQWPLPKLAGDSSLGWSLVRRHYTVRTVQLCAEYCVGDSMAFLPSPVSLQPSSASLSSSNSHSWPARQFGGRQIGRCGDDLHPPCVARAHAHTPCIITQPQYQVPAITCPMVESPPPPPSPEHIPYAFDASRRGRRRWSRCRFLGRNRRRSRLRRVNSLTCESPFAVFVRCATLPSPSVRYSSLLYALLAICAGSRVHGPESHELEGHHILPLPFLPSTAT